MDLATPGVPLSYLSAFRHSVSVLEGIGDQLSLYYIVTIDYFYMWQLYFFALCVILRVLISDLLKNFNLCAIHSVKMIYKYYNKRRA